MTRPSSPARPFGVSVVIPTFNRKATLLAAVESVATSAPSQVEIIVVDDASSEDPARYLPACNRAGVTVRSYRLVRNRGPQAARNLGVRRARFRFVAFLDSDDRFRPEKVDVVLETLRDDRTDLLFHDTTGMVKSRRLAQVWYRSRRWLPFPWWLAIANPVPTPALVVRRRHSLGLPWLRYSEDWSYLLHYCDSDTRVRYLPLALTEVDRAQGTAGGLSQSVWHMRRGEFAARRVLLRHPSLSGGLRWVLGSAVSLLRLGNDLLRTRYKQRTVER